MVFIQGLIYALIFIMGTLFGSFLTLAVYRIPLGIDIVCKHSFCPKCKAELKFRDLIPIVSYISLGGKCRYCGEKVRIRYLVLELLTGILFLLFAISLKVDVFDLSLDTIIYFWFFVLYFSTLLLIAGIDKEKKVIQKSVLFFGLILAICFMIYACISYNTVIYTYIIILAMIAILLILDSTILKNKLSENYTISILILSMIMIVFSGVFIFYYTVASALLLIGLYGILNIIVNFSKYRAVKNAKDTNVNIPIGFFLVLSNIFLIVASNFLK